MNRAYFLLTAVLAYHGTAAAQTLPGMPEAQSYLQQVQSYVQQVQSLGGARGGRGGAIPLVRSETGKPFSATVTTQTTQTLADGTRLSQTTTVLEFRDAEGRIRTETTEPDGASGQTRIITIRDTVAGVTYRLDTAKRSALKLGVAMPGVVSVAGGAGGSVLPRPAMQDGSVSLPGGRAPAVGQPQPAGGGQPGGRRGGAAPALVQPTGDVAQAARSNPNDLIEDLGTVPVNGIAARGTRVTTVVPVGAIGNDRELRSISERWFSPDLNLLVKSISTDPRFGTTTYELTSISRQPPDPSLFQVPGDYSFIPVASPR